MTKAWVGSAFPFRLSPTGQGSKQLLGRSTGDRAPTPQGGSNATSFRLLPNGQGSRSTPTCSNSSCQFPFIAQRTGLKLHVRRAFFPFALFRLLPNGQGPRSPKEQKKRLESVPFTAQRTGLKIECLSADGELVPSTTRRTGLKILGREHICRQVVPFPGQGPKTSTCGASEFRLLPNGQGPRSQSS